MITPLRIVAVVIFIGLVPSEGRICSYTDPFDGSTKSRSCPGECCGSTLTYCCPTVTSSPSLSGSCTQISSSGRVTTLKCSNGCCGSLLSQYCCSNYSYTSALSTTVIIIIVVSCVVFVAIIVGVIICCVCCCRQAANSTRTTGMVVANGQGQPNVAYTGNTGYLGYPGAYPMNAYPGTPQGYPSNTPYPVTQPPTTDGNKEQELQ